ncbi:MAG TPA: hypothetical protein VF186_04500 [Gaiellaceae bacterium]
MSARKPTPAEARERRAKIAAVVLTVVFVAVCAFQVPRVLKHFNSSSTAATSTTTTTSASPAPAAAAPAVLVSARATHLSRLSRFAWKDPFRQQLQPKATAPAAPAKPPAAKPQPKPKPAAPVTASAPPAQTKSFTPLPAKPLQEGRPGVLLLLDGKRLGLLRGDLFPTADPVFRLVSFTKKAARVALLAGTLSDGGSTLKLQQGHELVLRNATTGDRYVLELVRPARVVPREGAAKPKA